MIQLYDDFNVGSQDLHYSLRQAGFDTPALVFNDDGFLPETVTSPYAYFCQMQEGAGKPLYFNQVPVPEYWEITGNNTSGEVWCYNECKAKLFYAEPKHLRLVSHVDWYDKYQKVRFTDHYNRFGWLFARTYFAPDQSVTTKSYFNQEAQEVIVENALTGNVILNWQGKVHVFDNRLAFVDFYIRLMGWDQSRLIYNSLSTPFFYSYYAKDKGRDMLFWQEPIEATIPGNMAALLANPEARTQTILVQNRAVYAKLQTLLSVEDRQKCHYLGYIYPILRENLGRRHLLIVTNSDQIEQLSYLVEQLSDYVFHIAALTEMSPRLMAFDGYANVHLYPNISPQTLDKVYDSCDIYLDINRGDEVMDAVRRAFEHQMLLLAFEQTAHRPEMMLEKQVFDVHNPEALVCYLRSCEGQFAHQAEEQGRYLNESIETYQTYLTKEDDHATS